MKVIASSIRIHLFRHSREPVLSLLAEHGVEFVHNAPTPGVVMASGEWVDVVKTVTIAAPLAGVVVAFLKHRHGRKVIITSHDRTVIHAENLTHDELVMVLEKAASITAIDTGQPPKAEKSAEPPRHSGGAT
ncbi:hypothetical protein VLK31_10575 [Variovorax sp. H27-G14]|uniref:hypothetical protein n=1 Tax=Variovorax sp. H27-G14 TaxID=3111914 RepID=UPI0038FC3FB5